MVAGVGTYWNFGLCQWTRRRFSSDVNRRRRWKRSSHLKFQDLPEIFVNEIRDEKWDEMSGLVFLKLHGNCGPEHSVQFKEMASPRTAIQISRKNMQFSNLIELKVLNRISNQFVWVKLPTTRKFPPSQNWLNTQHNAPQTTRPFRPMINENGCDDRPKSIDEDLCKFQFCWSPKSNEAHWK